MKLLLRNTTEFEYLENAGTETDLNDQEEHTGEYSIERNEPVTYRGTISVPSGYANQTFYGQELRYSHVLVMDDPKADIREDGLIRWQGELYEIRAVRPSLNVLSIALRKIVTNAAEQDTPAQTEPDEPVGPDEPVDPDEPGEPDEPGDPDAPVDPDEPTEPEDPEDPTTPADTDDPTDQDGDGE